MLMPVGKAFRNNRLHSSRYFTVEYFVEEKIQWTSTRNCLKIDSVLGYCGSTLYYLADIFHVSASPVSVDGSLPMMRTLGDVVGGPISSLVDSALLGYRFRSPYCHIFSLKVRKSYIIRCNRSLGSVMSMAMGLL